MTNIADEDFESPIDNPELLKTAEQVISGVKEEPPAIPDPLDGPVVLPSGFRRLIPGSSGSDFQEVTKAWVRELNGEDEERVAKARLRDDPGEYVRTLLEAGVERLGDAAATKDDLASLVLGDREYLLMEIARATYGDSLEYDVTCPGCGEEMSATLSIKDDIPVTRLTSVDDQHFEVALRKGRVAKVSLPTGEITGLINKAETTAETNTLLIAHCVQEITGPGGKTTISGDEDAARQLGISDRRTLVDKMSEIMPGPQYNEVKFPHEPGCGEEIHLRVTLADLFRGL